HAARPDLLVVLMSTYDARELPAEAADCGAACYLHKEHLSAELLVDVWRQARHPGGRAGLDRGAGRGCRGRCCGPPGWAAAICPMGGRGGLGLPAGSASSSCGTGWLLSVALP